MSEREWNDHGLLSARLYDAVRKCGRGEVATLSYLTQRECKLAKEALLRMGLGMQMYFWGGYPGAERQALFLLPEYLTALLSSDLAHCESDEVTALLGDALTDEVTPLLIKGSGFATLSHRDFLGSVLSLGIERDAVGDLCLQSSTACVLFCSRKLAEFLKAELMRVGGDKVQCYPCEIDDTFTDGRNYRHIHATVASPRLDAAVAALTGLSREGAQTLIRTGLVEMDHEEETRPDRELLPPVTLSVRGYGRYILRGFEGQTRKGRLRLAADQLI